SALPFRERPWKFGPETCVTCVIASLAFETKGLALTHRKGVASEVGWLASDMATTVRSFESRGLGHPLS
ncbi:MAG: hypothetical protein AB7U95_35705, partial [Reyranella sp.]